MGVELVLKSGNSTDLVDAIQRSLAARTMLTACPLPDPFFPPGSRGQCTCACRRRLSPARDSVGMLVCAPASSGSAPGRRLHAECRPYHRLIRRRWGTTGGRDVPEDERPRPWKSIAATSTEERTRLILETANDAFVAINHTGAIVEWNRAAEGMFGYTADEAIGRQLAETIIPSALRDDHQRGLDRFVRTGQARMLFRRVELTALHREGHEFPVELTIWPTREDDDTWRFNAFIRDITERKRREREAHLLHRITALANEATTAEEAVRGSSREILDFTGWELAHTYVVSGADALRPSGWWETTASDFTDFRNTTNTTMFTLGAGLPGTVAASKTPQWIVDISTDHNFSRRRAAIASGLRSGHAFPVLAEERVVAVLEFYSSAQHPPDRTLLELMSDVGIQLGRVFERQEALESRSQVIAMVAHELRTPLATMIGFAGLLEDAWEELSDPERLEHVRAVSRHGDRLRRIVSDLLTVSRGRNHPISARPVVVSLAAAVREAVAELDVGGVHTEIDQELTVLVDRDHFSQIITNLLNNAAKYGQPPIVIDAVRTSPGLEIRVCDQGEGVPHSFVPDLFVEFARGSEVAAKPGIGLGLPIVRRLAEASAGTAGYRHNEPHGACFIVTLPTPPVD